MQRNPGCAANSGCAAGCTVGQWILTVLTVDWYSGQLPPEHVLRVLVPWVKCDCLLIGGNDPRLHHLRMIQTRASPPVALQRVSSSGASIAVLHEVGMSVRTTSMRAYMSQSNKPAPAPPAAAC